MRDKKLTFIIGAGASSSFNYPTGIKLRETICEQLSNNGSPLYNDLIRYFQVHHIHTFREQFYLSNNTSIDFFLVNHPEYLEIGKFCIILTLTRYEHKGSLGLSSDHWFQYIARSYLNFDNNKNNFTMRRIKFITFNYDRLLEELLYNYIRHSFYPWSNTVEVQNEIKALATNIPIVHIYGRLDKLAWEDEGGREYGDQDKIYKLMDVVPQEIELVRKNDNKGDKLLERLKNAHEYIQDSDYLVFLGFSFDPLNFDLLDIGKFKGEAIISSAFELQEAQLQSIKNMFPPNQEHKLKFGKNNHKCEMFLRDKVPYL